MDRTVQATSNHDRKVGWSRPVSKLRGLLPHSDSSYQTGGLDFTE